MNLRCLVLILVVWGLITMFVHQSTKLASTFLLANVSQQLTFGDTVTHRDTQQYI